MILYRYIVREFIKPFLYSVSTIMLLFLMQLAVKLLPRVLYKGVPASVIVELFAVNLAHIAVLSVPMALLISMLMVFGKLTSDNELAAIKAGGHSVLSLLSPVIAISGLIGALMLFFNTAILPEANHHGSSLLSDILKKKPAAMIEQGVLIKDFPGYAIMVDSVDHSTAQLFGVKIFSEERGEDPSVTVAEHGTIYMTADEQQVELSLYNGETHTPGKESSKKKGTKEHYQIRFEKQVVYIENVDSDLKKSEKKNRGDREKTNDLLLEEVKSFKKVASDLQEQHVKYIDDLLKLTSSLSEYQIDDSLRDFASSDDTMTRDSLSDEDSVEVLLDNVEIVVADQEDESDDTLNESSDSVDVTDTVPAPFDPVWAILQDVKEVHGGRDVERIVRSASTKARLRSERTDKQNKRINSHLVEVHKKYALAVSVIVFALLGVPLGIISRSGSVAISVSYSIFFFIVYYAFLVAGEKLSESKGLSPELAMWIGNITLLIIAVWLLILTVQEKRLAQSRVAMAFGALVRKSKGKFIGLFSRSHAGYPSKPSLLKKLFRGIKAVVFFPATITRLIMPKLPAYILGRFFSFFFTVTLGLTILTVVIDYISMMGSLEGATPVELFWYYIYFMAWFLSILLPMALLIATMMTIGSFAKTNELTAIKAAGISMIKMTVPLLLVGLFFSLFSFYFTEKILPQANKERSLLREIFSARRNNRPIPSGKKSYKHEFYYFSNPETAYRFTHFQTLPARGDKVTKYDFSENRLSAVTSCKKMLYEDSSWTMINGLVRKFDESGYTSEKFARMPDNSIADSPEDMVKTVGVAEELSYGELKEIMSKAQQRGEDISKYEADLLFKFALPLMNFIVILIGVSVTARSDKRGGAVHFGAGMGLVALYWAVSQFLLVLGRGGELNPLFAAWSGTVLFLVIGLLLYRKASL